MIEIVVRLDDRQLDELDEYAQWRGDLPRGVAIRELMLRGLTWVRTW